MTPAPGAVRERPILFSAPMVRAILAGTKTQTRRIVKPQPTSAQPIIAIADDGVWRCPYGTPGDRLWVRETIAIESWTHEYGNEPPLPTDRPHQHTAPRVGDEVWHWPHYRATDPAPELSCERDRCRVCESGEAGPHWRPSIHMPRWACRIVLEISDVRVDRLQAISAADAIAEGIDPSQTPGIGSDSSLVAAYARLWNSINGAGAWESNPWVWALTFKRVAP